MRVEIRVEIGETHDFQAWCLDSSMGRVLLLAAAGDFLDRLIQRQPDHATWGAAALKEGLDAGVMRVEVDTLRNSPVNAEENRGLVQHEGLIEELARKVQDALVEDGRRRNLHPPCHPDSLCRECRPHLAPFQHLPAARQNELRVAARAVLQGLAEKGLTA